MNSKELKFYFEPYREHICLNTFSDNIDDIDDDSMKHVVLTFAFTKKEIDIFLEFLGIILFLIDSEGIMDRFILNTNFNKDIFYVDSLWIHKS